MVPVKRCFLVRKSKCEAMKERIVMISTSIDLELCDRLPSVHSHSPALTYSSTAQVDDELLRISIQSIQDRLQAFKREDTRWKEKRSNYNLLRAVR